VRATLQAAIRAGGTSLSDYVRYRRRSGAFGRSSTYMSADGKALPRMPDPGGKITGTRSSIFVRSARLKRQNLSRHMHRAAHRNSRPIGDGRAVNKN